MVFDQFTKLILSPIYYTLHHNYVFGFIHKLFFKNFYYKQFKFELNIKDIPIQNRSSFLFKTYEYNDRKLIEKHITKKNKSIIIGGGIGFIPVLTYKKSLNKILVFEINNTIINNLKINLIKNNTIFKIYNKNLNLNENKKKKIFYLSSDFLNTSSRTPTYNKILIENINKNKIKDIMKFNTLILDVEGDEEYYILNIDKLKNIKYLFFELHYNILSTIKINKIMKYLKKNNFELQDKCFNSFYFKKN